MDQEVGHIQWNILSLLEQSNYFPAKDNTTDKPQGWRRWLTLIILWVLWLDTLFNFYIWICTLNFDGCHQQPSDLLLDEGCFLFPESAEVFRFALQAYRLMSTGLATLDYLKSTESKVQANRYLDIVINFQPIFKRDQQSLERKLNKLSEEMSRKVTTFKLVVTIVVIAFMTLGIVDILFTFLILHRKVYSLPLFMGKFMIFTGLCNLILFQFVTKFILICQFYSSYFELINSMLIKGAVRLVGSAKKTKFRNRLTLRSMDNTFQTFRYLLISKRHMNSFLKMIFIFATLSCMPLMAHAFVIAIGRNYNPVISNTMLVVGICLSASIIMLAHQAGNVDSKLKKATHTFYGHIRQLPLSCFELRLFNQILNYFMLIFEDSIAISIFGNVINANSSISMLTICLTFMAILIVL